MKKCQIIAEIGSTHDGSIRNACKMIEIASKCGANIAKFQTHIPEAETLPNAPMPSYFKGEPRFEYFKRTGFTIKEWKHLKKCCEKNNIEFMSSVFSIEAVDLLEKIGVKRYKIPSGEVTNLPMLEYIAKKEKPIILSSGMSDWRELDEAVDIITKYNKKLTVLQCTSAYPAKYNEIGLNVMLEIKDRYSLPVGLSDHSLTNYSSFAAVTLGATIIEKHFTLSKNLYGSDAKHSLEPHEFSDLAKGIRAIEEMLKNKVNKNQIEKFNEMKQVFQKSIVSKKDILKDEIIKIDMISIKKPGTGIPPKFFNKLIGKIAKRDIKKDTVIKFEDIGEKL